MPNNENIEIIPAAPEHDESKAAYILEAVRK